VSFSGTKVECGFDMVKERCAHFGFGNLVCIRSKKETIFFAMLNDMSSNFYHS
jgi:hypothetical protein